MADSRLSSVELDPEKFFDLSVDMVCIAGMDGRFKKVNPAFERVLGWSTEELLARPYYDFVHPDDVAATEAEVARLAEGNPTISFENRYLCADGSYKNLVWTAQPDPESGLMYSIARDMTDRRRRAKELELAKEAAESAARVKSQFLANMSHEIRTPMNGIIGMAELALQTSSEPAVREQLQVIRQSAEALLLLLHDILDFSKLEADKVEIEARAFELRDVIGDAVKTLAVEAHRGGLEIAFEVDASVPRHLVGDPLRVRQVVLNLVGNAVKFTDEGEVVVRAWSRPLRQGHEVTVEVRDTGIGIAEGKLVSIFDSFSQGDATWRRRFGGTGLGLAICARLVELMGGKIEVESREGVGSTFRFTLRLGSARMGSRAPRHDLGVSRALVVEANATTRGILTRALGGLGIETTVEPDLASALERAKAEPEMPLVLVEGADLDANASFVRRLRRLHPDVAVVAILTTQELRNRDRYLEGLGVDASLTKPYKESELVDCLRRALGLSAAGVADPIREKVLGDRPLHVLLAEDSPVNRQVASGLLESAGHRVDMVETGVEAVEAAGRGGYDVILMDIQMPEMDGLEATRTIRRAERDRGVEPVPIIALTAHALEGDRERCLEAGMTGYLAKPLRALELMATIHEVREPYLETAREVAAAGPMCADLDCLAAVAAVGADRALLDRLVGASLEEGPMLLKEMRRCAAAGDAPALAMAVHRLKGALRYFCQAGCLAAVDELERAARAGDLAGVENRLPAIEERLSPVFSSLETWRARAYEVAPTDA